MTLLAGAEDRTAVLYGEVPAMCDTGVFSAIPSLPKSTQ